MMMFYISLSKMLGVILKSTRPFVNTPATFYVARSSICIFDIHFNQCVCSRHLTSWLMKLPSSTSRRPSSFTACDLWSCLSICRWYSWCFVMSCSRSVPSPPSTSPLTRDSISLSQELRNRDNRCQSKVHLIQWSATRRPLDPLIFCFLYFVFNYYYFKIFSKKCSPKK